MSPEGALAFAPRRAYRPRVSCARRAGAAGCLLAVALAAGACGSRDLPVRPHIVIVLADDLGWHDVGYHGSEIETPTLDALASESVRLDPFYVAPVCSPTRAALLTGRYPLRTGMQEEVVRAWADSGLPPEERTLAEALGEVGYRTAMVGKWHLGMARSELLPTRQGFEHHYGSYLGMVHHDTHRVLGGLDWHRNELPVHEPGHSTDLLAREAEALIAAHDPQRPLFLYAAFLAPHPPLVAPPEDVAHYAGVADPRRRVYAAMVSGLDAAVSRIVRALEQRGMWGDTLLLFASDNGADPKAGGSNQPLRGGKSLLYEGGVRVPAFVRLPGGPRAGATVGPVHVVDVYPTLVAIAGGDPRQPRPVDGVDLSAGLLEAAPLPARDLLLGVGARRAALRSGDWKLVLERTGGLERAELFDLAQDPEERHDRAGQEHERVEELRERLARFAAQALPVRNPSKRPPPGFRPPEVWGPTTRP